LKERIAARQEPTTPMSTLSATETVQPPATDRDALTRLERFGGIKLLDEMIALYLANAPERLAVAAAGVAGNDAPAAENALHSLKSSSAQLGAARLSRLCEQGETIARDGRLAGLDALLEECGDELSRVERWLANVRAERST
jgi:two-component system, sensor histidine kinase and response regulator